MYQSALVFEFIFFSHRVMNFQILSMQDLTILLVLNFWFYLLTMKYTVCVPYKHLFEKVSIPRLFGIINSQSLKHMAYFHTKISYPDDYRLRDV